MRRSTRLAVLTLSTLLALPMGLAGAHEISFGVPEYLGPGTAGTVQVGDIQHVKNVGGWSGSDIEFASKEVVKLSDGATGTPVCKTLAEDGTTCLEFEMEVRDFAVAGALSGNARVIDITDPRNPVVVAQVPCAINQNDIQIQGNLLLVASDSSGGVCQRPGQSALTSVSTGVIDFSNPRAPKAISRITYSRGSHNHTIHPTQPIVYLSDSDVAHQGLGNIPVWDLSNPTAPVLKTEFKLGAHSPHDITFNASGTRAYVAAVSLTYILNTENPAAPTLVSVIPNEGVSISHQADPTPDGKYLLVADELGGGAAGLSPGGPVHVYDIRDETRPVKVGLIWDDCVGISHTCDETPTTPPSSVGTPVSTAHVFRINPDGYTMAIAWYKDGVHVIDFSDVRGAGVAGSGAVTGVGSRTVGRMKMPNANTWAAKMWQERHPGYVFANDINRGLDVFYVPSMGPGFLASGTVTAANPAVYATGVGVTKTEFETECDYSPRTNGVDGWVTKIPAKYGDGTWQLTANARIANPVIHDFDMYFYDKDCGLIGSSEETGDDETGKMPEGTAYALVSNFWPGNARLNFYVSPAPAPTEE